MHGKGCAVTLLFLLTSAQAYARTITVGHGDLFDHQSITAALTEATWGDSIVVATGVYSVTSGESFPLEMKSGVSLVKKFGDSLPEIRGDMSHSVLCFENVVAATVTGITIRDGSATRGGGVTAVASSFTLKGCKIVDNYAISRGAGIYVDGSSLTGIECNISGNRSFPSLSQGGGVFGQGYASEYILVDCEISENHAAKKGGCGFVQGEYARLKGCSIRRNTNDGLNCLVPSEIQDCTIEENTGVGVGCSEGSRLLRCCIRNNGGVVGGGVSVTGSSIEITNCVIVGNGGDYTNGGAVHVAFSWPLLRNCTIARNVAKEGGVLYSSFGEPRLLGCIVYGNSSTLIAFDRIGSIGIECSDVEGGWEGLGNIDSDPRFVDAEGGDFRLQMDSPCIDSASINGPETDILGNARPIDIPGVGRDGTCDAFDMGAYEYTEGGVGPCTPTPTAEPTPTPTMDLAADINGDDRVDARDLLILLADWKKVTGR